MLQILEGINCDQNSACVGVYIVELVSLFEVVKNTRLVEVCQCRHVMCGEREVRADTSAFPTLEMAPKWISNLALYYSAEARKKGGMGTAHVATHLYRSP